MSVGLERAAQQGDAQSGARAAIVLAAGRSRRFGRDKRLEPVDGVPMFLRTALALKRVVADTLVVLAPDDALPARMLADQGIEAVFCPQAALGMGHSLACAVGRRREAAGWFVMPADMPFVQSATLQAMARAADAHELAAPLFDGRRGHPVWFARRYLRDLLALQGDQGARGVLAAGKPYLLPVDDPGCVCDIDRPQDLCGS